MPAPLFLGRLLVVLLCALALHTHAQQSVEIPADVEAVVTGGKWVSAGREGTFRVVVRTGGFEHVVSQVQVDWLAVSEGAEGSQEVVASAVAETGSWRVLRARVAPRGAHWYALIEAVETHFTPVMRGTWEVRLGAPGELNSMLRRK